MAVLGVHYEVRSAVPWFEKTLRGGKNLFFDPSITSKKHSTHRKRNPNSSMT